MRVEWSTDGRTGTRDNCGRPSVATKPFSRLSVPGANRYRRGLYEHCIFGFRNPHDRTCTRFGHSGISRIGSAYFPQSWRSAHKGSEAAARLAGPSIAAKAASVRTSVTAIYGSGSRTFSGKLSSWNACARP